MPAGWLALTAMLAAAAGWGGVPSARAQRAAARSIGPGRIVCTASFCEMGVATKPEERYRVITSGLPEADTSRLRKCTGVAKACVVTVDGLQQGDTMKIMATRIIWQDQ